MPPIPHHNHAPAGDHAQQPQQQEQQQPTAPQRPDPAALSPPLRQWLKYALIILSGFLLGVILGMLSTSLVLYFVPASWLEHALKHRKAKMQEHVRLRQMCRGAAAGGGGGRGFSGAGAGGEGGAGGGFIERYDGAENVVEICTCWPGGVSEMGGWFVSCAHVGLMGYIEQGGWGNEVMRVGG